MHPLCKNKASEVGKPVHCTLRGRGPQCGLYFSLGNWCPVAPSPQGPPGSPFPAYHSFTAPVRHSSVVIHSSLLEGLPMPRTQERTCVFGSKALEPCIPKQAWPGNSLFCPGASECPKDTEARWGLSGWSAGHSFSQSASARTCLAKSPNYCRADGGLAGEPFYSGGGGGGWSRI